MSMLSLSMKETLERARAWLTASSEIMFAIESELKPTTQQVTIVGMEWAGLLSRLERIH